MRTIIAIQTQLHRWRGRHPLAATVSLAAALLVADPAIAEDGDKNPDGLPSPSITKSVQANGDPTGWFATRGMTYGLSYTSEVLGNPSGGVRRGGLYEGKLEGFVAADLEKLIGWNGLSFFSNAFQTHRTSGARDRHFESLITISNIEATPSTRLSELWLEQNLFNDRFSVRAGQITADAEFFISEYSKMFISSDWPTVTGANLPSGGPAYPLATPGVRLKFDPTENWTALVALFNGDPGDQTTVNRHGTNFRMSDPPLLMGEIQYRYNQDKDAKGLAGIWRLGAWHHFGKFEDQRFDDTRLSMADPLSSGTVRLFGGTSGVYGIVDQQIYRPEGGGPDSGVSMFSRIATTPSDRNLVDFYLDAGIVFSGILPSRPDDKFGASFICAHISDQARALDRDTIAFSGVNQPLRDYEMTFELSYQAQVVPGWAVQPLFQYIVHPGGHVPHTLAPASSVENGALFGVRSTIVF